jgi:hypothetical protein
MIKGTWIVKRDREELSQALIHIGDTYTLMSFMEDLLITYPSAVFSIIPQHTICSECGGEGKHLA